MKLTQLFENFTLHRMKNEELLKQAFGFSLAEVIVATGLVGGLSLVVANLVKNTNDSKSRLEGSFSELESYRQLVRTFSDSDACLKTRRTWCSNW